MSFSTRRQSLAAIAPLELLSKIFLYNKGEPFLYQDQAAIVTNLKNASQVCKQWRDAALSCPFLWHDVADFGKHGTRSYDKWVQLMLDRSGLLPVVAKVNFPNPNDPNEYWQQTRRPFSPTPNVELLFTNLHRVGELNIVVQAQDYAPAISYFEEQLRGRAPQLKILNFELNKGCFYGEDPDQTHMLSVPFLSNDNHLEEVKLFNMKFGIDVTRQSFSNLLRLEVSFNAEKPYTPPTTTKEWLDILREMPKLQELRLDDWIKGGARVGPNVEPVHLPHLDSLDLDRHIGECVDFLMNVKFPTSANLSLRCRGAEPGADWHAISTYLSTNHNYVAQEKQLTRVDVTVANSTFNVYVQDEGGFRLQLQLWTPDEDDWHFRAFDPSPTVWMKGLGNAEELHVSLDREEEYDQAIFRAILAPFTRTVTIWIDWLAAFLSAFEPDPNAKDDIAGILLPEVDTIYCLNRDDGRDPRLWPKVADFVRRRRDQTCDILVLGIDVEDPLPEGYHEYIKTLEEFEVAVSNMSQSINDPEEQKRSRKALMEQIQTITYYD